MSRIEKCVLFSLWMQVKYERGVFLPEIGLWLDPARAKSFAFVSHAHSDHTAAHKAVIVSEPTALLMQERLGGRRTAHILAFGESRDFHGWRITLYPAGHIFGSAQVHLVAPDGDSLLYTGDFKLRPGLSAEPLEWVRANTLVMETTFGLPRFCFPPTEEVIADVIEFCHETIADGGVPVLLGYSLGKAQEILSALDDAGLRTILHPSVARMTAVYEKLGRVFAPHETLPVADARGGVIICPPHAARSPEVAAVGKRRVAVLTGWAVDRGAKYRFGCDAAFPLSDHAGHDDLLRYVEMVAPECVLTLHGYAEEFAAELRAQGREAWALTGENQLELGLPRT